MNRDRGFLYLASGDGYFVEAERAATSVKEIHPELPIACFTDKPRTSAFFDKILVLEDPKLSLEDKPQAFARSPFQETVFIDTDTLLVNRLDELFLLLDRFELLSSHVQHTYTLAQDDIPDSFIEPNTGFMLWRKSERISKLFKEWDLLFTQKMEEYKDLIKDQVRLKNDQLYFRKVLYESDISYYPINYAYNLQFQFPTFVQGNQKIRVLHGRGESMQHLKKELQHLDDGFAKIILKRENLNEHSIFFTDVAINRKWLLRAIRMVLRLFGKPLN